MKDFNVKENILFEDNHLIGVNKPSGILSQMDNTGDLSILELIKSFIKQRDSKPGNVYLGSVHRLDRPTSGAMIFAKTSKANSRMNLIFQNRAVQKTYLAVVHGYPAQTEAYLENFLIKDHDKNTVRVYDNQKQGAKLCQLNYHLLSSHSGMSLLKVEPITGRAHQIRAQLSNIGIPILGDLKYGAPRAISSGQIALHCSKLEFIHPVSKESISISARTPLFDPWPSFES